MRHTSLLLTAVCLLATPFAFADPATSPAKPVAKQPVFASWNDSYSDDSPSRPTMAPRAWFQGRRSHSVKTSFEDTYTAGPQFK